ncbi:MAG: OmpH family outer membrane protein [Terriglobia bacterium]
MRRGNLVVFTGAFVLSVTGWLGAQQFESLPQAKEETPPTAAAGPGTKVGIINIQMAMAQTQEGKKATEDLRAQFDPRRAELENLQAEIRQMEEQLRTQERTLSADARLQLLRDIETRRKRVTRGEEDLRSDIEKAQADYVNRIGEKMRRVLDRYAKEKGLTVIFDVSQGGGIVYALPSTLITEEVVALYDQTYPVQTAASAPETPPARPNQPQPQN